MKRWPLIVGGVLAVGVAGGAAAAPGLIRSSLVEAAEEAGYRLEMGSMGLHWLGASASGVKVFDGTHQVLMADGIKASVAPSSLLGDLQITSLVLDKPDVHLILEGDGSSEPLPTIGSIMVDDGDLQVFDGSQLIKLTGLSLSLSTLDGIAGTAAGQLSLEQDGQPVLQDVPAMVTMSTQGEAVAIEKVSLGSLSASGDGTWTNGTLSRWSLTVPEETSLGDALSVWAQTPPASVSGTFGATAHSDGETVAFQARIKQGQAKWADVPPITQLALELSGKQTGEALDINVKRFTMRVIDSTFSGAADLRGVGTQQPSVSGSAKGVLDLQAFTKVFQLPGMGAKGKLDVDLMGNVMNQTVRGTMVMQGVGIKSEALPAPLSLKRGKVTLNGEKAEIDNVAGTMGRSDFVVSGSLDNVITYLFGEGDLKGETTITGRRFDLRELGSDGDPEVPVPPPGILLTVRPVYDEVQTEDLLVQNTSGVVALVDNGVTFKSLAGSAFGGRAVVDGTYTIMNPQQAKASVSVAGRGLDVGALASTFESLQTLAPVSKHATGDVNTEFRADVFFDPELNPELGSLTSDGSFEGARLLVQPQFLKQVAKLAGERRWTALDLDRQLARFTVKDGQLMLGSTAIKLGSQPGTISGSSDLQKETMDLRLETQVSTAAARTLGLATGSVTRLPVTFRITGPTNKPTVKVELRDAAQQVKEEVKEQAKRVVQEKVSEVVNSEALVAQAQKAADKLLAEAQAAGKKLVSEARKAKKKLVREAGDNPIKKAAAEAAGDKLVAEAKKKADKLEERAAEQGDRLVKEAKAQ